jgi:hypothetical protein
MGTSDRWLWMKGYCKERNKWPANKDIWAQAYKAYYRNKRKKKVENRKLRSIW